MSVMGRRVRRAERELNEIRESLTVGDVGQDLAIEINFLHDIGVNEHTVDRVEDTISKARLRSIDTDSDRVTDT